MSSTGALREPPRRRVLLAVLGVSVAIMAAPAVRTVRAGIRALRPAATGTSATRCGLCGASAHSMLTCPVAPEVI